MNPTTRQVDSRDPPEITPEQWNRRHLQKMNAIDPGQVRTTGRRWKHNKAIRDTKSGREWRSLTECARTLKMSLSAISTAIALRRPIRSGRLLEYVDAA